MSVRAPGPMIVEGASAVAIPTQALYITLIATALLAIVLLLIRTRRLRDESMLANEQAAGARDLRGYALALLDIGHDAAAEDAVRAYLDRISGDAGFRALMGALAALRGDLAGASTHLEHALRLIAPDGQRPPAQRQRLAHAVLTTLAGELRSLGRAAEADRYLQMARALADSRPEGEHQGDARAIVEIVRDDDAEQSVFERLSAWDDRPPAPRAPGLADSRAALHFFRAARRRGKPSAWALGDLALAQEAVGQAARAERTLRKALRTSPRDPWLLHARGEYHWRGGQLDESRKSFSEALQFAPHRSATAASYALVEMRLGRFAEAATLLRQAMSQRPDISLLPVLFGRVAQRLGRDPEAEEAFARAEQLGANDALFQTAYADALAAAGKSQAAEARYRLAARADGPRGSALAHYGEFLLAQQRFDEADEALVQASSLPGGEEAYIPLARLDLVLGRLDRLQEHVQAAIGVGARQADAREVQARTLLLNEKYEEAAGVATRLIELEIKDPEIYLVLGQALVQLGRADDGRAALLEATRHDAALAETKLANARALFDRGYLFGARLAAADALALRPDWPAAREGLEAIVRELASRAATKRSVTARSEI